jgi:hypothetical protein
MGVRRRPAKARVDTTRGSFLQARNFKPAHGRGYGSIN